MARVVHHDGRSLTTGGLLPGALSLGDTQDCIIGGFHHGGALALRAPRRGRRSFRIIHFFEFLHRAFVIIPSGLWQASKYIPPKELSTSVKPEMPEVGWAIPGLVKKDKYGILQKNCSSTNFGDTVEHAVLLACGDIDLQDVVLYVQMILLFLMYSYIKSQFDDNSCLPMYTGRFWQYVILRVTPSVFGINIFLHIAMVIA